MSSSIAAGGAGLLGINSDRFCQARWRTRRGNFGVNNPPLLHIVVTFDPPNLPNALRPNERVKHLAAS
jgi:hypothetical protein